MDNNNYHFFSTFNQLKKFYIIAYLKFFLRYFKCYKHQNQNVDYFFLLYYLIHYTMFILLSINKYIKDDVNAIIRVT